MVDIKLRALYPYSCALCGAEHGAAPSPAMESGHNEASARCRGCGALLRLTIFPDLSGETMASEEFGDYLDRIQAEPIGAEEVPYAGA